MGQCIWVEIQMKNRLIISRGRSSHVDDQAATRIYVWIEIMTSASEGQMTFSLVSVIGRPGKDRFILNFII